VLAKFVVYGRLVRQLVPFFCLATALAAEDLAARPRRSRWVLGWGGAAVAALAAWNFAGPLRQVFPDRFRRLARAEVFQQQRAGHGVYRVVEDAYLWGKNLSVTLPPHAVVLRRWNPLQFRPYQYEGFSAAQRADLNRLDVSMRLIRFTGGEDGGGNLQLGPDAGRWGDYPGPVRMRLRFEPGIAGQAQPLVTAGTDRRADFLYVVADAGNRLRFGFDHWGAGSMLSDPVEIDFAQPHELVISMGALLPPGDEILRRHPELAPLRSQLLVMLDGKVVWSLWCAAYSVNPETITFGTNFIGGNLTVPAFAGRFLRLERVAVDEIAPHMGALAGRYLAARRPVGWQGAVGPVKLRFRLPEVAPGVAQPLVAVGRPGEGELVFWIREPNDRIRFGLDRWGEGAVFSDPVAVAPGAIHEVTVSLGSMLPAEGSPLYQGDPSLERLRRLVVVSLDGRSVLLLKRRCDHPTAAVAFGANTTANSVASAYFTGNLLAVEAADPSDVVAASVQLARRVTSRPAAWQGYPGPVRLKLFFPTTAPRVPEPLIVTGQTGKGDFIYVRYEGKDRIRVGFDHWGVNGGESPPVAIDRAEAHELAISFGALMPPGDSPLYRQAPDLLRLRTLLWVSLDGRPIFVTPMAAHPTRPAQIILGANFIGGSTAAADFTGRILAAEDVDPDAVLAQLNAPPGGAAGGTR
jgi:hypothetical protein